ncbi:MAG: histidine--tRNA ligase [Anaerolineales bacterium]|nr:histidine--tRNA ligase [Anaerolineales bacterium]
MKATIQSIKGTRDFYPEVMAVRNFIYNTVRKVSESFGYQEWEAPLLESIELYAAKSGEELVKEQAFVFPDRGGDLITLRPELTPSLARMVAQRQRQLVYPLRWWSWGPFWRYERPQKGRTREFFQWNIDLIGVDSPEADAELAAIAASFLQEAGLSADQVSILVNNRALMDTELLALGIPPEKRLEVFRLIDRRDKLSPQDWATYAEDLGLSAAQFEGLKAVLADEALWRKSDEMVRFFEIVDSLGIRPYVRYAPQIIRGLDYYTGTVFEVWDRDGEFRAILGGGRYDNLVSDVGGEPLPAVGFAMGDVVVGLVLEKFGCLPQNVGRSPAAVLVTVFDEGLAADSFRLAAELRQAGLKVACYPEAAKLGKQFKYGDRMGMRVAVVLGPEEKAGGQVAIKDLRSGEQAAYPRAEASKIIQRMLAANPAS